MDKLLKARLVAGLTTSQVAARLGVNQSSVVRLEQSEARGSITMNSLEKAAKALGCSLRYELRPDRPKRKMRGSVSPSAGRRGRRGALGEALRLENLSAGRLISGEERLRLALELSDFAAKLKKG